MPPKIFKKPQPASEPQVNKQEEKDQPNPHHEELFINPKALVENAKTLERIRILVSLLSGIIAGLFNVNQLLGPLIYFIMHALITGLIVVKVRDTTQYFLKKTDVFSGIGSGVLIFLCAWMIIYNVVYTL